MIKSGLQKRNANKYSNALLVLRTIESIPKSVKEISNECNIPLPTAYRIINELAKKKLLEKSGIIDEHGVKMKLYKSGVLNLDKNPTQHYEIFE